MVRHLKKSMTISSEIDDSYFFEKYNKIWKKIEELMGKNSKRKPHVQQK